MTVVYLLAILILHELAHALAAWACGATVWGVVVGCGPVVWQGSHVRLRLVPIAVKCAVLRDSIRRPWQEAAIALGPFLLGLALLPLGGFGLVFLAFTALDLLPLRGTDGWRVLRALTARRGTPAPVPTASPIPSPAALATVRSTTDGRHHGW